VFLEVRESNQAAIAFYSKHGFAKMGRRPSYYRVPDEAAIVMEKKLTV
jgi:ribosomal-protein-alanine N-acetyltransferase